MSDETPAWLRKKILARDGKRCVLCGRPSLLDAHHMDPRSSGGRTEPKNLTTLCRPCHGLVHQGLIRITGEAPHDLVISDKGGNPMTGAPRREEGVRIVMRGRSGAAAPVASTEDVERKRLPKPSCRGLGDIVGQKRLVESLRLLLAGAKGEPEAPLDPILLTGEPGFGKTRVAEAIAAELEAPLIIVSGPLVRDAATLVQTLVRAEARSVLFIDEIQALPIEAQSVLLEAIEKRRLSMPERTVALAPFTVIAATNHPERLPNALHSRFAVRERLDDDTEDDLVTIASRTASNAGLTLEDTDARKVARVSRGTPRECVLLTKRIATMSKGSAENCPSVDSLLESMGTDARGLDPADRKIVAALRAERRPLSLASLHLGQDRDREGDDPRATRALSLEAGMCRGHAEWTRARERARACQKGALAPTDPVASGRNIESETHRLRHRGLDRSPRLRGARRRRQRGHLRRRLWLRSPTRFPLHATECGSGGEHAAPSAPALNRPGRELRSRGMSAKKKMTVAKTFDEYLATLSAENRVALEKIRKAVRAAAPKAEECISYRLPAFRLGGKPLVAMGASAKHCAFYLMSTATLGAFEDEVAGYDTSPGTIRFSPEEPPPAALVKKLVKARISEISAP